MIYNPKNDPRRESFDPGPRVPRPPAVRPPAPSTPDLKPWYRRVWDWAVAGHKALTAFGAICVFTVGAHAWLAGLVTKKNVDETVQSAVSKALLETNTHVKDLEAKVSDLPTWRGDTTTHDAVQDTKLQELKEKATAFDDRLERMRARR